MMSQAIMRLNGSETAVLCPVAAFAAMPWSSASFYRQSKSIAEGS